MTESRAWVDRIVRVTDYIQTHLDEELAPEHLAGIAEFSLHHFHRVFRGITGESVMGYVRRLRLERAAQRLKFGGESVTDVAMASGYGSHEAFTRAFTSQFGTAPSAYRERERTSFEGDPSFFLREESERHCLSMRHTGSYLECGPVWAQLERVAAGAGLMRHVLASSALCYDDPDVTRSEHLRYDACLVMPMASWPMVLPAGCTQRTIPAGRYAVAVHRGSFDTLLDTYVKLMGHYLPTRGVELVDEPVVETYLTDPARTAPQDLRTEVSVRIA
ncbi:MAG: AraC family transcriptional regulator [Polyangiaceae bacterium]|nr:AraC family transcriptional regulator [Polyangiaceae bacterium]